MLSTTLDISSFILSLESEGRVTRTFRRLDPERQTAVILAIFEEANAVGPQNLNIKRVAERANVSVGSLYQYFGSRENLLDFTIELVVRAVQADFEFYRSMLVQLPLREALLAYGQGAVEWANNSSGFMGFYSRAAYGGDPLLVERVVRPVADTMLAMTAGILQSAQQRGELRPGIDLPSAIHAVHALIIGLYDPILLPYLNAYFQIDSPESPAERTIQAGIDLILRGILADPAQNDVPALP